MNRHADEVDGKSEPGEDQRCGLQGVGGGFGILRRADRPSTAEDEDEKKLTLQLPLLMRMLAGSGIRVCELLLAEPRVKPKILFNFRAIIGRLPGGLAWLDYCSRDLRHVDL